MYSFLAKKIIYNTAKKVLKIDAGDVINQDTVSSIAKGTFHIIKHILF